MFLALIVVITSKVSIVYKCDAQVYFLNGKEFYMDESKDEMLFSFGFCEEEDIEKVTFPFYKLYLLCFENYKIILINF